ncbi:MAG TPA: cupin domain-containing protein [Candidatus Binatia bacterium]|jgi:quercetin dioxygenase-like cupin family protein
MKRSTLVVTVSLVAGIVVGFTADRLLHAQQDQIRRTTMLQTTLEGVPDKTAEVFLIEMAPGAATGRHSHPGSEMAYILEGSAAVEAGGNKTAITQRRGSLVYLTPNMVHDVRNPSRTETLKAIVFALYDKGKPTTVPAPQ